MEKYRLTAWIDRIAHLTKEERAQALAELREREKERHEGYGLRGFVEVRTEEAVAGLAREN